MIQGLTDLADQAVIVPVLALTGLCLMLAGHRHTAFAWAVATLGTLAAVLLAKLSVAACGAELPGAWHLHSPSGHTASAAAIYGGLAALLLPWPRLRTGGLVYGVTFAGLFAGTRLALGVHSVADVIVGGGIGIAGAGTLAWLTPRRPSGTRFMTYALVLVGVAILVMHGTRWEAEHRIGDVASMIWPFRLCAR